MLKKYYQIIAYFKTERMIEAQQKKIKSLFEVDLILLIEPNILGSRKKTKMSTHQVMFLFLLKMWVTRNCVVYNNVMSLSAQPYIFW